MKTPEYHTPGLHTFIVPSYNGCQELCDAIMEHGYKIALIGDLIVRDDGYFQFKLLITK